MPVTPTAVLPNFIVAGASKSGTTSLYHYLCQHPQIYMSPIKEPTFFGAADLLSDEKLRQELQGEQASLRTYLSADFSQPRHFLVTEWDDYLKLFRNVRGELAIGEASVSYIWLPSATPAIRSKLLRAERRPMGGLSGRTLGALQTAHPQELAVAVALRATIKPFI